MVRLLLIVSFLCTFAALQADPWGKDADLAHKKPLCVEVEKKTCPTPLLSAIGERMIKFHQDVISPADGPRSHFYPSSSQYTKEAMIKYGFFKGFIMGCDRLMRENNEDWVYPTTTRPGGVVMKYDPVK